MDADFAKIRYAPGALILDADRRLSTGGYLVSIVGTTTKYKAFQRPGGLWDILARDNEEPSIGDRVVLAGIKAKSELAALHKWAIQVVNA